MIAKNVMKIDKHDNSITFRVACSCSDPEHEITIDFEKDDKIPGMYFMTGHVIGKTIIGLMLNGENSKQ